MESPSEPKCRTLSPWRGLLITASILSCWIQPMSAQFSLLPNPLYGEVNRSITLDIQGFSGQPLIYIWYRNFSAYYNRVAHYTVATGMQEPAGIRQKVFPNGSLLIPDLTLSDTDNYIVAIFDAKKPISGAEGHLTVYERTTKPNLTVNRTSVIENDTLVFTCGAKQAGVDILWFFNNKSLILNERMKLSMNNQTLTILSVKREDVGFYECEIRNPISSNKSDPITLTVNYGPNYITFVPNSEKGEIELKFKGSLTLECRVESYPPAQYRWQFNGIVHPDFSNSTYVIKNAICEDSGKYTCLAKNNVTNLSVSKSITVKVVERTTKPNLTVNRTSVIENDTLDFTCGTEQAGGNILWFFNNISLILNERMKLSMNNQTLTILSVKRKGAGSYQCKIQNSISSSRSDPIILVVNSSILSCWIQPTSAQVSVVPNPPFGEVNHNVTLDIQDYSGRTVFYTWYKKAVAEPNRIARYLVATGEQEPASIWEKVLPNGSLLIPDLTLSDTDDYHVTIINSQGDLIFGQGHLTVYGPLSKPLISSTNMAPVENKDNVSLTCQFEGQGVTYQWFINQSSPAGDRIVLSPDNRTLTIIKVTREDQGPYKCETRNPVSFSESEFTLNITYGRDIPMIFPTALNYPVGATIELNCSAESYPPAQLTWLINGIQMTSTSKLSITNVSLNHTGTYTCNASNSVTGLSSSKYINITVSERTTKPNLMVNRTNVIENDTLVFTCGTEQAGVDTLWFFNNKSLILNERMKLSMNNQTLTILSVKREDVGFYECEIQNPISSNRSDPITLTVNYGSDNIMFVPNPEKGEIEVKFNDPLTLECHVESYPPAQYLWQVNGTMNSAFSNNAYVIKNATWEDSGKYTCVAKNNVTNLSVSKSITVKVVAKQSMAGSNGSSLSGGAITGIVIGVLAGIILIGTLIYIQFFRKTERTSKHQLSGKNHSARKHGEDNTLYENTVHLPGSALPAQGWAPSPSVPKVPHEHPYEALEDIYDKTLPWKKPEA